jgi:hypothetical protein
MKTILDVLVLAGGAKGYIVLPDYVGQADVEVDFRACNRSVNERGAIEVTARCDQEEAADPERKLPHQRKDESSLTLADGWEDWTTEDLFARYWDELRDFLTSSSPSRSKKHVNQTRGFPHLKGKDFVVAFRMDEDA